MHKGKNAKYVVDFPKKGAKYPHYRVQNDPKIVKPIVQVDADTVPGAEFYAETKWILPGGPAEIKLCETHTHNFNEVLGFFGYNYDNIQDLGAEIEIWIDNEKNIVDRSFCACIPAGVPHGPVIIRNIERPIFHVSSARVGRYE
ncbi:MAG: hypothetical protein N2506_02230 [Dehalococcoidales bacterium]|nr:hypothetical protein [Dehalococcoidales bacterium]